jgi:hypothetical protein
MSITKILNTSRRGILAGQDEHKTLEILFENIDLSFTKLEA